MIIHLDKETIKELENNKQSIEKSINSILNLLGARIEYERIISRRTIKENPYIVKSVIKHLSSGLNLHDSMILTAENFSTSLERVETVYSQQKRYMSAVTLFARRFAVQKLIKSGFTKKEISKILGVSENHIYKMMKCVVDFWFMER